MDSLPLGQMGTGERLRHLRLFAGLSVKQVAQRWQKSEPYVYRVERDETVPSRLEIEDIERAAIDAARARGIDLPPRVSPEAPANGASSDPGGRPSATRGSADAISAREVEPGAPPKRRRRRPRPPAPDE